MTGREYYEIKEAILSLNLVSYGKGYNYTFQSTSRYNPISNNLSSNNWIDRWKNTGHKYDEMVKVKNIVEAMAYISQEFEKYKE